MELRIIMPRRNGFEREVMTHLEYIKEKQDSHEKKVGRIYDKLDEIGEKTALQNVEVDKRFDKINVKIAKAEGYAKGAMAVGGVGGFFGIFSALSKFLFR